MYPFKKLIPITYGINAHDDNIKLVKKYMQFGSPLNQGFLIDSITKRAKHIAENPDEVRRQFVQSGCGNFIDVDAWIKCAEDWLECQAIRDND